MKPCASGKLLVLLTLGSLFLAACQPPVPEIISPADEPTKAAAAAVPVVPVTPTEAAVPAVPTAGAALPPADMMVPEGWQFLEDARQGYSLAFPPEWNICQKTRYSWTFCDNQQDPARMGHPLRLYVSAFPADSTNADWEIYNFIPTQTLREFMALPVGASRTKIPGSPQPEYITYTRLPDRMVAGLTAPVIENTRLWDMPSETKEQVVFLIIKNTTYIIGMYYETPEQLAVFLQVLDHFQMKK